MFVRIFSAIVLAIVSCSLLPLLPAQSAVPQSYTLTATSSMALEAMFSNAAAEVKVSRFGPREYVDVSVGAPPASKAVHARHWFDLVAHKAYSIDAANNTCSWMSYTSPAMPAMYDPLATPAPSAEELAALNKKVVRRENVNGVAAGLIENSNEQGKSSMWFAVNGNYPLKVVMTFSGASPLVMLEVKELRFEKPDLALLAPPANCTTQAQGEWTAQGISAHGETTVEVQGSGEADLKTGETTGNATEKAGSQPR